MNAPALAQLAAEFGDIRVVLPGTALAVGILCWRRNVDIALAFLASIVLCIVAIAALKLIGLALERAALSDLVGSPSGHVALGTVFTGSIALILSRGRALAARVALGLGAALLVVAIAQSRIARDAHSHFEALEGAIVGLVSMVPLARRLNSADSARANARVPAWPLIAALSVLAVAVFQMTDIDTESIIRHAVELLPLRHH